MHFTGRFEQLDCRRKETLGVVVLDVELRHAAGLTEQPRALERVGRSSAACS